jgi:hypothetical protein
VREDEAKALKVGDRVKFHDAEVPSDENGFQGTVTERNYSRFVVKWDDGIECSYSNALAKIIQHA